MSQQEPPPRSDWRTQRHTERMARRAARREGRASWAGPPLAAIILIVIGAGLLMQNFGFNLPERWWALLLLLPAIGSLVTAIRSYRAEGGTPDVIGALVGAIIFTALAFALFLGLDWGIFWPVILIALGVGLLARAYWPRA